ncbi:MAG TPA: FliA/WhiG family RNA polymerase sigma factor, partial [Candidatus Paceibacterota bacterium]|nr:FliA/WhiG family RNA polymerase sigma factor [Candidatus Paceibacterota bacterium]
MNAIVLEPPPSARTVRQRYKPAAPGSAAENERVKEYLHLVKTVVGRLAMTLPPHVDLEDLQSAGLVGLLNAIRNYDPKCGSSMETYASLRIRGAVFDELRKMDWVPRSIHAKARKVRETMQSLEQAKGSVPSEIEMAKALKISLAEYQQLLEEIRPTTFVCLDAAITSDSEEGPTQYESIADNSQESPIETTSRREIARLIAERLEQLPEIQRKVLALYYFEDLRLR